MRKTTELSVEYTGVHERLVETFGQVDATAVQCSVARQTNVEAEPSNRIHRAGRGAVKQETLVQLFMKRVVQHVQTYRTITIIFTTHGEVQKALFLAPSVCGFFV